MSVLKELRVPIVLAPLAGGPSTVELAVAVCEAGALGFLAAGYRSAEDVREQVHGLRERTERTFGVNVFAPAGPPGDAAAVAAYAEELRAEAERAGVALGEPRHHDDAYGEKLSALEELRVPVVSFTFGCPSREDTERMHAAGSEVWVTVTTGEEAAQAAAAGADVLVAQGAEAGGHRGGFSDGDEEPIGLLALLQVVRSRTDLPLAGAGGIATAAGVRAVRAAGASAAQAGTAFLLCPEAGTSQAHREAIARTGPTALTRAFSGRTARGIVNRFMREHEARAPAAYPEVHHLTAPLRQAGRERGDAEVINLWAGQAHALAQAQPAAEVVRALAKGAG
ncbi:MAG TPA: nitronate monooxygenase [Solirubrobacteraceae bacterium]|nr:nitronate monooxygenase [Solirubrobacteraceae bacterium]